MKRLRIFYLIWVVFICNTVLAQSQSELGQLMRERGEYYFTLDVSDPSEIQAISKICSVDGTNGRTVVAYANQREYDKLLDLGYQPTLQMSPSLLVEARMWDGDRATYEWDSYPTYSQYESMMEAFPASATSHDRSCSLITLGTLASGRKIMGVRINNGSPEGKPRFLYSSTIHGNETTGWIMMLRLIDELCTSTESRILNLVDSLDIFIFPNTNPDGTYYGGNNTVNLARRYNANNVDLNRHFPDFNAGPHPDGATSYEPEATWMMNLAQQYLFTMGANYHGGDEVVNYPWDNTKTHHADDAWWQLVCREYADLVHQVNSDYMDGFDNGIVYGADWYMIGGGRQDYMNYYAQCREVTIECSNTKKPKGSNLPNFWNYNHNSILTYMERCLDGVHGFVYDAETGLPIEGVTVTVLDHDFNNSFVTTHEVGDFHRPIKGGTYTIVFSKEGYVSQTIEVTIEDGQRIDLDNIQLLPLIDLTMELAVGWNWWAPLVEMTVSDLETALDTCGIIVNSQDAGNLSYEDGVWEGTLDTIVPGQMYRIQTSAACSITQYGSYVPVNLTITPGYNWFGYQGTHPLAIENLNITPTEGDKINSQHEGYVIFENGAWNGTLEWLQPGHGYVYMSNATENKDLLFPVRQ